MENSTEQRHEELKTLGFDSDADYQEHHRVQQASMDLSAKQKADSIAAGSTAFDRKMGKDEQLKLIGNLLDYAERFAQANNEPPGGHCQETIRQAQAWHETGSTTIDPNVIALDLIEYVERFAESNGEPVDGDGRKLLMKASDAVGKVTTNTRSLLRELAETLGELHRFARNEQAKDPKRNLLSPAADVHIAALIDEGLRRANVVDCHSTVDQYHSPRG